MDCGRNRPRPESWDRAMHDDDGRSVSECQKKQAKPVSWAWSCLDGYAGRDERGRSGFRVPQKCGIVRLNSGASGECRFKGIAIADNAVLKNREGVFNETACRRKPESILFDRAKLRVGLGRKDKEFCDILDFADDGLVRIINCKPLKGASSVNYLFSQAKFYCEAFLTDDSFLTDIRAHIDNSGSTAKDRYLAYISADVRRIKAQDYRVCLWLLCDQREAAPTRISIPLIAQYELKLMHDHLSRVCKFSDIILRFVPVQMVNFTRKAAPKAKVA